MHSLFYIIDRINFLIEENQADHTLKAMATGVFLGTIINVMYGVQMVAGY